MKVFIFLILSFCFLIASCKNPSNSSSVDESLPFRDTILLTNGDIFYSCCKTATGYFELNFPSNFKILHFNSTEGGSLLFKRYEVEKSILIDFLYSPGTRYDTIGLISSLYCNSPKDDCIPSPIIEDATGKTTRIHCIDSNLVCNGFGKFDGKGYLYLKVEDYRPIPIPIKEAFAEEFLSSYVKWDTIFHFKSIINGSLDSSKFDLCIGKTFGRLITGQDANTNELCVVLNKDWYDGCLELYSLANCLIEEYFLDKKFKMITLVAQQTEGNNYKRLATFIIRDNTDIITKETIRFDGSTNFVDCIWIDKSFANKLYSEEDCERWHMGR